MSNMNDYEYYKNLLLISWSKSMMISHMAKHYIPSRKYGLHTSSVISNEMRMRILNRSSLVRCLSRKLLGCDSTTYSSRDCSTNS
jgi:hypothetical protein